MKSYANQLSIVRSFDCTRISDLMYFMGTKRAPLRMLSIVSA